MTSCLQCGPRGSNKSPCENCGHVFTPTEITRSAALVQAVARLPGEASPTDVAILQEQILAEEKRRSRLHEDHVVVNAGHMRALIGLLGGSLLAAIRIGVHEQTLNHYVQRGRMSRTVLKKLKAAAIERFKEIIK